MAGRILIIEDENKIVEICRDYLLAAGFQVQSAEDGPSGLEAAEVSQPDLVLLDLILPGLDGLSICRRIRSAGDLPVIILTARNEECDRLAGLESGADDCIAIPFSPREMVARVRAVLRRAGRGHPQAIRLDRNHFRAFLPGGIVALTPTEFDILATLASEPGQIFSRAELLQATQGVAFKSYERAIDSHIRNLRRKIEAPGSEECHIITVHGFGYKFVE